MEGLKSMIEQVRTDPSTAFEYVHLSPIFRCKCLFLTDQIIECGKVRGRYVTLCTMISAFILPLFPLNLLLSRFYPLRSFQESLKSWIWYVIHLKGDVLVRKDIGDFLLFPLRSSSQY